MSESKPTPGPWRVTSAFNVDAGSEEEPTRVAKCWTSTFAPPPREAMRNAELISAAPDLLAILERAVRLFENCDDCNDSGTDAWLWLVMARDQIAKAKGIVPKSGGGA